MELHRDLLAYLTCLTSWRMVLDSEKLLAWIFLMATVRPSLHSKQAVLLLLC